MKADQVLPALPIRPALVSARYIEVHGGLSKTRFYAELKAGRFPAPAIKDGPRYTRWRWRDVAEYLDDPQGWIDRNAQKSEVTA